MSWTKIMPSPHWAGFSSAAKLLNTTDADIKKRIANGEFVTQQSTPNLNEIKFWKTDGSPKYIVADPNGSKPIPTPKQP